MYFKFIIKIILLGIITTGLIAACASEDSPEIGKNGLLIGDLLYEASFSDESSVQGWSMDGPGVIEFKDGWMYMYSPNEEGHHVFWAPERFPENFVAQWEARNHYTEAGLCIVFFAAAGKNNNESVFDEELPDRDGTFGQYTQGALRNYHIMLMVYLNQIDNKLI